MAINMPHAGGLATLSLIFGTTTKAASHTVLFYASASPITLDDADALSEPVTLIDLTDYSTDLTSLSAVAFSNATLEPLVEVVTGVPQLEFPEIAAVFSGALSSPSTGCSLYGYAISNGAAVIFRELFEDAFIPQAGAVLRFIPTIKLGNTTANLT